MVDSGIPLGPGLLATWVLLPNPHTKIANARINAAPIAANVPPLTLPSLSFFHMRFSFVFERLMLGIAGRVKPALARKVADQSNEPCRMVGTATKPSWQASQIRCRKT